MGFYCASVGAKEREKETSPFERDPAAMNPDNLSGTVEVRGTAQFHLIALCLPF